MILYRAGGFDLTIIERTTLVLVGVGSLGSEIARLLTLPWKKFVLIDPDILSIENLERHLLGPCDVGKPKVDGVAHWLRAHNVPAVIPCAALVEEALDELKCANLIIVATGGQKVPGRINHWNEYDIPMITAGVHAYGSGGKITVLPHPSQVCYVCMQYAIGNHSEDYAPGTYGVEANPTMEAVPALRHTVTMVASLCADAVLCVLQEKSMYPHVIRWANEWSTIGTIPKMKGGGSIARLLRGIAPRQNLLGALPNIVIEGRGSQQEVRARRIALEQPFGRHEECPFHTDQ